MGEPVEAVPVTAPPLLVVAGPTASGKSALGLEVAERLGGEIVSADAFAVYRGLDIGTDKPGPEARRRIPHHLVDVCDPRERFSAGRFARAAREAIRDIVERGRVPVVVGGTHFYIRALILGLFPQPPTDPEVRLRLERAWEADPAGLFERLASVDPELARRVGPGDRQRILRGLEVFEVSGSPLTEHWKRHRREPLYRALIAVPERERGELYARIEARVGIMFSSGLVAEVRRLLASGVPPNVHAFKAIGYREVLAYLRGDMDLDTAVEATKRSSRHLAKRQLSWLRHADEGHVVWVPPPEHGGAEAIVDRWSHEFEEGEGGAR